MISCSLYQFLKYLPNLSYERTKMIFGNGLSMFIREGNMLTLLAETTINGHPIRQDELINFSITHLIDASAASAIIRLYKAGALPMQDGLLPAECPKAEEYLHEAIETEAAQAAAEKQRWQAASEDRKAYRTILANPSLITEELFSLRLLDDLFIEHLPVGAGELAVGNIMVRRSEPVSCSGSGDTDLCYYYSWTSSQGAERRIQSMHDYLRGAEPELVAGGGQR